MYQLEDTIVAVSSPTSYQRAIIRLSGPGTRDVLRRLVGPGISGRRMAVKRGAVAVDEGLSVDADLYFFAAPRSYTGEDVAEIHVYTN
ncbi:MAG: tRNA uridine-5-carboxymethylaminomethyl(34) synthesis GTPase MnmE, partial [Planctomycetota bacterium]